MTGSKAGARKGARNLETPPVREDRKTLSVLHIPVHTDYQRPSKHIRNSLSHILKRRTGPGCVSRLRSSRACNLPLACEIPIRSTRLSWASLILLRQKSRRHRPCGCESIKKLVRQGLHSKAVRATCSRRRSHTSRRRRDAPDKRIQGPQLP